MKWTVLGVSIGTWTLLEADLLGTCDVVLELAPLFLDLLLSAHFRIAAADAHILLCRVGDLVVLDERRGVTLLIIHHAELLCSLLIIVIVRIIEFWRLIVQTSFIILEVALRHLKLTIIGILAQLVVIGVLDLGVTALCRVILAEVLLLIVRLVDEINGGQQQRDQDKGNECTLGRLNSTLRIACTRVEHFGSLILSLRNAVARVIHALRLAGRKTLDPLLFGIINLESPFVLNGIFERFHCYTIIFE